MAILRLHAQLSVGSSL